MRRTAYYPPPLTLVNTLVFPAACTAGQGYYHADNGRMYFPLVDRIFEVTPGFVGTSYVPTNYAPGFGNGGYNGRAFIGRKSATRLMIGMSTGAPVCYAIEWDTGSHATIASTVLASGITPLAYDATADFLYGFHNSTGKIARVQPDDSNASDAPNPGGPAGTAILVDNSDIYDVSNFVGASAAYRFSDATWSAVDASLGLATNDFGSFQYVPMICLVDGYVYYCRGYPGGNNQAVVRFDTSLAAATALSLTSFGATAYGAGCVSLGDGRLLAYDAPGRLFLTDTAFSTPILAAAGAYGANSTPYCSVDPVNRRVFRHVGGSASVDVFAY